MGPLLLLDGNSLAYRAFFALPTDMATTSGQVTNAVFGFTSMLTNLIADHKPDALAVAFDLPAPTFRHKKVPGYKANRAETPDILRQQMGLVRRLVQSLQIASFEVEGFEADDVLATLATAARDKGRDVIIVTGDRDAFQLVEDPWVRVLYVRRGVSDYVLYDEASIFERTGVTPSQYPHYAALRGDPSDNLPGVPGIGEKTAAKLISSYGSVDGIFDHLDELRPKLAESLQANSAQLELNVMAIPLVRDVPLGEAGEIDRLTAGNCDSEEVRQLFGFLEFRNLLSRLTAAMASPHDAAADQAAADVLVAEVRKAADTSQALEMICQLKLEAAIAVAAMWAGHPGRSELLGLAITPSQSVLELGHALDSTPNGALEPFEDHSSQTSCNDELNHSWGLWISQSNLASVEVRNCLVQLFGPGGPELQAHHGKELGRALSAWGGQLSNLGIDTAVGAYLVDPSGGAYPVADLALRFLDLRLSPEQDTKRGQLDLGDDGDQEGKDAVSRAIAISRLAPVVWNVLVERGQAELYSNMERPLVGVLTKMEVVGIKVDVAELRQLVDRMGKEAAQLETTIKELAGVEFNVGSTPQLRQVLYDKLGLQPQRKTKTGYSTDAATLEKLRGQHPIVEALLRYREVEKLRSTFGVGLLAEVADDGRIHASFNQTVARTGRLSSDRPNLHNIPVRSEEGRGFRRCFVPQENYCLLVADYDQIELRVIAHLSGDVGLLQAFEERQDIHATTAAQIFAVSLQEVTPAMRSKAKMVSYGLAYGMEAFGLSQRLGVSISEAEAILAAYFVAFPGVRSYMDATIAQARQRGYTETSFGRRRHIPELASSNYRIRQAGERQAMNAGIQGLAADIFKVALLRLDERLEGFDSRLVLQVHDEVLVEVPQAEEEMAWQAVTEALEGAAELRVPLSVHLAWGSSWEEAKG